MQTDEPGAPDAGDAEGDGTAPAAPPAPGKHVIRNAVLRILLTIAIVYVAFGVVLPHFVDYGEVADALGEAEDWIIPLLAILAFVKFWVQGFQYTVILPGLRLDQGTAAWLSSTAVASTIPGPFDLAVRYAMYATWGFTATAIGISIVVSGIYGTFAKMAYPVLAAVALSLTGEVTQVVILAAAVGLLVLGVSILVLAAIVRSERFAIWVGNTAQRLTNWALTRFKRQPLDGFADKMLDARLDVVDVIRARWWMAVLGELGGAFVTSAMLVASVRALGMGSDVITWAEIFTAWAIVQVLTIIPITPGGIGIAELGYIGVMTAFAGDQYTEALTAAVLLFRVFSWLIVIPIGWTNLGIWMWLRRRKGEKVIIWKAVSDPAPEPAPTS